MNFNIPLKHNKTHNLNRYLVYHDIKYRLVGLEKISIRKLLVFYEKETTQHRHYFAKVTRNTFYFCGMAISYYRQRRSSCYFITRDYV